jgi:hypothetical protein
MCFSAEVIGSNLQPHYSTIYVSSSLFYCTGKAESSWKQTLPYFKFSDTRRHFHFKVSCSNVVSDHFICPPHPTPQQKKSTSVFLTAYLQPHMDMNFWKINGNTCVHRTYSLANKEQISTETSFNNKTVPEQLKEQLSKYKVVQI